MNTPKTSQRIILLAAIGASIVSVILFGIAAYIEEHNLALAFGVNIVPTLFVFISPILLAFSWFRSNARPFITSSIAFSALSAIGGFLVVFTYVLFLSFGCASSTEYDNVTHQSVTKTQYNCPISILSFCGGFILLIAQCSIFILAVQMRRALKSQVVYSKLENDEQTIQY